MENDFLTLYHSFKHIVRVGTEQEARQFLLDHINEFPEDVKNPMILALFEDAVNDATIQESTVLEVKEKGAEYMTALERAIRICDDKLKILDLQEKI